MAGTTYTNEWESGGLVSFCWINKRLSIGNVPTGSERFEFIYAVGRKPWSNNTAAHYLCYGSGPLTGFVQRIFDRCLDPIRSNQGCGAAPFWRLRLLFPAGGSGSRQKAAPWRLRLRNPACPTAGVKRKPATAQQKHHGSYRLRLRQRYIRETVSSSEPNSSNGSRSNWKKVEP